MSKLFALVAPSEDYDYKRHPTPTKSVVGFARHRKKNTTVLWPIFPHDERGWVIIAKGGRAQHC